MRPEEASRPKRRHVHPDEGYIFKPCGQNIIIDLSPTHGLNSLCPSISIQLVKSRPLNPRMGTTEPTINDALAEVLRRTRRVWRGADIVRSENTRMLKGSNERPDILISQSTGMQFTPRPTIGGRAWLSIKLPSVELEKALVLWANTSLGLLLRWWHSNKQQSGRGAFTLLGDAFSDSEKARGDGFA